MERSHGARKGYCTTHGAARACIALCVNAHAHKTPRRIQHIKTPHARSASLRVSCAVRAHAHTHTYAHSSSKIHEKRHMHGLPPPHRVMCRARGGLPVRRRPVQ
eukprot:207966-Chlamydomonas_euryale.AAC.1